MKRIINLTKTLFKANKNQSGKLSGKGKIILYAFLMVYILFIFYNFWQMFLTPLNEIGMVQKGINLILGLASIFMLMTSVTYVANVLYFSNDIENILPLPFKPREILIAKLFTVYIYELIISSLFIAPGIIAYGIITSMGVLYYLLALLVVAFIPIIPITVLTVLFSICMQLFKEEKYKNVFKVVTSVGLIALILVFELGLNANMTQNGEYSTEYILQMCESFEKISPMYLKIASTSLKSDVSLYTASAFLIYIAISLICGLIGIMISEKFYLKCIFSSKAELAIIKKKNHKSSTIEMSFISKDMKYLFRNPTYLIQCVVPTLIIPILLIALSISSGSNVAEMPEILLNYKFTFSMLIVQFFMLFNTISVTSISRDKKYEYMYLKTLPVSASKQLRLKSVSEVIIGVIGVSVALYASARLFKFSVIELIAVLITSIFVLYVQSNSRVNIDNKNPKIDVDSDIAIVKQNMNIFYSMLYGFALALASTAFSGVLGYICKDLSILGYWIFYGIMLVIIETKRKKTCRGDQ